jgi:hypothetical protein
MHSRNEFEYVREPPRLGTCTRGEGKVHNNQSSIWEVIGIYIGVEVTYGKV